MKQLVWSPSSINFGSRKKGESVTAESTLSITEGSVLLTPGKISPVPWAGYPVQLKNTEGSLHIHPAFSFAAAKYYLTSAGALTTNRDIAELYLGNAGAGAGLTFLPVPITLVILTPPGEFDPADPVTVNYTSGAILWVKVFFKINDSEWFFYDTFNATGTFDIDLSGWSFDHGDVLTVKVQDDESESFYDTVAFTAMVATITIDSINGGLPLTYEGLFEDGMWYFASSDGLRIVDKNDPDVSNWFIGTGNADGDIDLDIKMLAITDVVVPETVQLGVAFDVSGNYVMLEDKIVIEGYNDDSSTWVKLHVGDYIEVADGSFTESVSLNSADGFTVNSSVTIRVRSYDGYALNGIDSTDVIVEGDLDFLVISAGLSHSLGIWDGKVYAWGSNSQGQLGDGSTTQRNKPVAVAVDTSLAGKTVVSVSAGRDFSLALCSDGTVHAWGYNTQGQLGDGSITRRRKPVAVAVDTSLAGKTVVGISAGDSFSLAVCSDGTAHAWGYNTQGQLGDGSTTQREKPVAVAVDTSLAGKTVVGISAGYQFSLAVCSDGTAHAWGNNFRGQLGDGSTTRQPKPVAVAVDTSLAGKTVVGIRAGHEFSLAVCSDGTAHAWGNNNVDQLGDGSTTQRRKPVAVAVDTSLAGKTVVGISAGYEFSLAVCSDGTAHAWGNNSNGQLGDGSITQRRKPVAVAVDTSLAGKTATQVSSGRYFTLIKCSDGTAHAWGCNSEGQLGDNSTTQRTKAVLVDTSGI